MTARVLRAPFPWFGGKSRAADLVWRAFGNVPNYVEPFAGSLAVLLARPHAPKVETANDKDGLIANFWRATKHAPDEVARWCDWPVNEADLHARHRWLVEQAMPLTEKLIENPDWFDAKVAGWWVWGICAWPGGQWCRAKDSEYRRIPELANAHGRGVHVARWLPTITKQGKGVHSPTRRDGLVDLFAALSERFRNVRVCCGDWTRVLGDSTLGIETNHGMSPCGILFDPPYIPTDRRRRIYREDDDVGDLSAAVRAWAIEHGENPALRIALCGFDGEHDMPSSWRRVSWTPIGNSAKRDRERIWFSPHCLDTTQQHDLFAARLSDCLACRREDKDGKEREGHDCGGTGKRGGDVVRFARSA